MLNRCIQVARVYFRLRDAFMLGLLVFLVWRAWAIRDVWPRMVPGPICVFELVFGMGTGAFVLIHAREQLAGAGARVLPKMHGAVMAVNGMMYVLVWLLFSLAFWRLCGGGFWGWGAAVGAPMAAMAWCVLWPPLWLALVPVPVGACLVIFIASQGGAHVFELLISGRAPVAAGLMLATSVGSMIGLGFWLVRPREEIVPLDPRPSGWVGQPGLNRSYDPFTHLFLRWRDGAVDRFLRSLGRPGDRPIYRWRVPVTQVPTLGIFCLIVVVAGLFWIFMDRADANSALFVLGCVYALVSGLIISAVMCIQLLPMLGRDLLCPVSREGLLRQIGLAVLADTAYFLGPVVVFFALLAWRDPRWLWEAKSAAWLLTYLAVLGLVLAIIFWLARYGRSMVVQVVMMMLVYGLVVLGALPAALGWRVGVQVGVSCGLMLVGGVILWDAYRRWLVAEIG